MPRPSCARYSSTPPPSSCRRFTAVCNCSPQSQRRLPSRSPVKQEECARTGTTRGGIGLADDHRHMLAGIAPVAEQHQAARLFLAQRHARLADAHQIIVGGMRMALHLIHAHGQHVGRRGVGAATPLTSSAGSSCALLASCTAAAASASAQLACGTARAQRRAPGIRIPVAPQFQQLRRRQSRRQIQQQQFVGFAGHAQLRPRARRS